MVAPYGYTDKLLEVSQTLRAIVEANKVTWGVQDTYLGDQEKIPRVPAVCVEPIRKDRELQGVPNITLNTFEVELLVYHSQIQSVQENLREAIALAETIEDGLHEDLQLANGGSPRMIHGFVVSIESGFTYKERSLYRAVRLTWRGINKTSLSG